MATAKLFRSGGSQAVRLPKQFRFPGSEVEVKRTRQGVLLMPMLSDAEKERIFTELAGSAPDFPLPEKQPPPRVSSRKRIRRRTA
ncbi:MAG: antitoxin [Opitutaceae bacterium]